MFPLILLIDYEILFNNNLLVRIENIYILHFNFTSEQTSEMHSMAVGDLSSRYMSRKCTSHKHEVT